MDAIDPTEHLALVHYLARRVYRRLPGSAVAFDDLMQAGYLGLVEAARGYEAAREVPFASYARPRVEGAIIDVLRGAELVSRQERRARRELAEREAELTARLGNPPGDAELALATRTRLEDVRRLRAPEPVETALEEAEGQESSGASPEMGAAREELARALAGCLEELTPQARLVVTARVLEELTLEALARVLGGSKDRIWRLEQGTRRALRDCLGRKGWEAADAIETASDVGAS